MEKVGFGSYSCNLDRMMHVRMYGTGGLPVLAFPTQDGMCNQWEDFGMTACLEEYVSGGRIQLFCVDTVDLESWSASGVDMALRSEVQERYFRYITQELLPVVRSLNGSEDRKPLLVGCSMGGAHSAICLLRRPELFCGMIGLSGSYDARYFTGGYMDSAWLRNSGTDILKGLPQDDSRVQVLRRRSIVLCCGQGENEDIELDATRLLEADLKALHIDAWVDYWGADVSHDWPWWKAQLRYFLPYVLEEAEDLNIITIK